MPLIVVFGVAPRAIVPLLVELSISKFAVSSLKTDTFDLDAGTLIIDSATNNGKIALGATPNTGIAGTNAGIYMDGTGDFLAYGNATNYLKSHQTLQ